MICAAREAPELAPRLPSAGEPAPSPLSVDERGLTILTELGDGLSTGLFIDQRDNRARIREMASGKQVLEPVFVHVLVQRGGGAGGREQGDERGPFGVERSSAASRISKPTGSTPSAHEFVQSDAVRFVRGAVKHGRRFDVIVLDPPSFATVGKATFRFERDIVGLMADCLRAARRRRARCCA